MHDDELVGVVQERVDTLLTHPGSVSFYYYFDGCLIQN